METQFDMEIKSAGEASREISGQRGRQSAYQPVALKYTEIGEDEAIVLRELNQNDVQNLRNLLYRKFGKRNGELDQRRSRDCSYSH